MSALPFTAFDKLNAIQRELGKRRTFYPRWIEQGRMTDSQAKREIAVMEAIEADYQEKAKLERLL